MIPKKTYTLNLTNPKTIAMGSDEYHNNVSPSIVGYAWIRMY